MKTTAVALAPNLQSQYSGATTTGGVTMASPFRADHVGSLLRPPELLQARTDFAEGRITAEALRELTDAAVLRALEMQQQAGVSVFSDGEYRRPAWSAAVRESVEGLVPDAEPPTVRILGQWQGPYGELATASAIPGAGQVAGARLRQVRRLAGEDAAFLRQQAPGPWKITMPGPLSAAGGLYKPGITDKVYRGRAEFVQDIVAMLQREVRALAAEGCSYVQLDSLHYVERITDPTVRARMEAEGKDPATYLRDLIAADNQVLEVAQSTGMTVAMHMCRGNNRSAWHAEGSYEPIAEQAFSQLKVHRFLLEYDTERAGGFEPLRFMPRDKLVVLGRISSKEPALESIDALRRRIDEAAKYLPLENLAISPQCGFASTQWGNLLTWDEQRRKLELVAETARKVWG